MKQPPPSPWQFPSPHLADESGLVAVGGDLSPGTILRAYTQGFFPMPVDRRGTIGWWSPDPRGILEPASFHVSRTLRRSARTFSVTIDQAFADVIDGCADPTRPHGWITPAVRDAYVELHRLGWAHSFEVWQNDALAGGLYGIGIGAFFAGESMFHTITDASKTAVWALVDRMRAVPHSLIDVQWQTPHLATLGATEMGRTAYLDRLRHAIAADGPSWPTD